jgi:hypothetical protein
LLFGLTRFFQLVSDHRHYNNMKTNMFGRDKNIAQHIAHNIPRPKKIENIKYKASDFCRLCILRYNQSSQQA